MNKEKIIDILKNRRLYINDGRLIDICQEYNLSYEELSEILKGVGLISASPEILLKLFFTLSSKLNSKNILDPAAHIGQVVNILTSLTNTKITGIFRLYEISNIFKKYFDYANATVLEGVLHLDQLKEKYDLIISDLPFHYFYEPGEMFHELIIKKCIKLITDNGYLIFTFPSSILINKKFTGLLSILEQEKVYINGIIDLPAGTYAPYTNISTKVIIFSKTEINKIFLAELGNTNDIDYIVENFISQNNSNNYKHGILAKKEEFIDINAYKADCFVKDLKNIYPGEIVEIINLTTKIIMPSKAKEFVNIENSIFIPKIGTSNVVLNISEFSLKKENYIQLILNERIIDRYFAFFMNTSYGKQIRRNLMSGIIIENLTKTNLERMEIIVPDIIIQKNIIEAENSIIQLENHLKTIKHKFSENPNLYKNIIIEMNKLNYLDSFDAWVENLPFPLSSILRKIKSTDNIKDKQNHYLHFFEAFSQFIVCFFFSVIYANQKVFDLEKIIKNDDLKYIRNGSFGTWVTFFERISKYILTKLDQSNDENSVLCIAFGLKTDQLLRQLCDTKLVELLQKTCKERNEWHGHAGVYSTKVYIDHIDLLNNQINDLKNIIGDVFERIIFIQSLKSVKENGVYTNSVKSLIGSNPTFVTIAITSYDDTLDNSQLYFFVKETEKVITALPFIIAENDYTNTIFYFFNKIFEQKTNYKSYHFESSNEKNLESIEILEKLKILIK